MTICCLDTETTGLEPINSGPFELGFLIYEKGLLIEERVFHLNPLNEEVLIHPEALEVNGVTEEQIRSYPPAGEIVPEIVKFLQNHTPPEKLVLLAYNAPFDYGHLGGLFFRCGFNMNDYFNGRLIDVLELVKKAKDKNLLPSTRDNKLGTIVKALGIEQGKAHTALDDIRATRQIYETIYMIERKGRI
ncbi:hypothetical protein AGMMS50268_03930 [Spirochaetia bacterium]|nr:hypothetical protein AGMMS50268_03930 [Spirochaetia bacterium]